MRAPVSCGLFIVLLISSRVRRHWMAAHSELDSSDHSSIHRFIHSKAFSIGFVLYRHSKAQLVVPNINNTMDSSVRYGCEWNSGQVRRAWSEAEKSAFGRFFEGRSALRPASSRQPPLPLSPSANLVRSVSHISFVCFVTGILECIERSQEPEESRMVGLGAEYRILRLCCASWSWLCWFAD